MSIIYINYLSNNHRQYSIFSFSLYFPPGNSQYKGNNF